MAWWVVAAAAVATLGWGAPAAAAVSITVDQTSQRMTVSEGGRLVARWPVSTARRDRLTPNGVYRPYTMRARHFSSRYGGAPMPWSIFYRGHYAIHGTGSVRQLGRPASAGCVRLHPVHARELFALVERHGMARTRIVITGSTGLAAAGGVRAAQPRLAQAARPRPRAMPAPPPLAPMVVVLRGTMN